MELIELTNNQGMKVTLANYGARVASILVPKRGRMLEMIVTPDDKTMLERDSFYLGATCGPVCNRITNASFNLLGEQYDLSKNDGENCLHGGDNNISFQYWDIKQRSGSSVTFKLTLTHLVDGFPGNRELEVIYSLSDENTLNISLFATSDRATPMNLTNHAYFNLGESDIRNLSFKLNAQSMLQRDANGLPNGDFINIQETGFNVKNWANISHFINNNLYDQIVSEQGVDHCFVVEDRSDVIAELYSMQNGIRLVIKSDQPAIQFYTGKFLSAPYRAYQGVCFEAQGFTDAINFPHFPSSIIDEGSKYAQEIQYQFDI